MRGGLREQSQSYARAGYGIWNPTKRREEVERGVGGMKGVGHTAA